MTIDLLPGPAKYPPPLHLNLAEKGELCRILVSYGAYLSERAKSRIRAFWLHDLVVHYSRHDPILQGIPESVAVQAVMERFNVSKRCALHAAQRGVRAGWIMRRQDGVLYTAKSQPYLLSNQGLDLALLEP